jgi:mevalonate kinase
MAILQGKSGIDAELAAGVGWQDPAVILETGWTLWKSGPRPELVLKRNPTALRGLMALGFTGYRHETADLVDRNRPYDLIHEAGHLARRAIELEDLSLLRLAIDCSYEAQLAEGMSKVPNHGAMARKYCGAGWGGYVLHLFAEQAQRDSFVEAVPGARKIEPYLREW